MFLTAPGAQKEVDDLRPQILKALPARCPILELINKADLLDLAKISRNENTLLISAKTGYGIEDLKQKILELIGWNGSQEGSIVARRRHLECIERAAEHIERSEQFAANGNNSLELFAEELSLAQNHLGQTIYWARFLANFA